MSESGWFCDTEDCVLHVPLESGCHWATVDGIVVDRLPVDGRMRCLLCRVREAGDRVGEDTGPAAEGE